MASELSTSTRESTGPKIALSLGIVAAGWFSSLEASSGVTRGHSGATPSIATASLVDVVATAAVVEPLVGVSGQSLYQQ